MTATEHTTTRRRDDALRDALAARRPQRIPGDPIDPPAGATSPLALAGLVERLQRMHADAIDHAYGFTPVEVETIRQATVLALAAQAHGYPRPPLKQLGAQAGHLPAARSSDPATARESGERTRSTPSATNHLGKLLRGFLSFESSAFARTVDHTLTSEELAHRVGLMGSEYAKRCSDLLALGYIRVAQDDDGHDRTRRGDSGRQRLVFELTDDGRAMARSLHI